MARRLRIGILRLGLGRSLTIAFFITMILLAGCTAEKPTGKPGGISGGQSQADCLCTAEYDPVCADGQTYSNRCTAGCAGKTNWNAGPCE